MKREDILKGLVDLDYFSSSFLRLEEDFQKFYKEDIPVTYLTDDILLTMITHDTNYFRLHKTKSKDGADHYFYFKIRAPKDNPKARVFEYDCVDKHLERNIDNSR